MTIEQVRAALGDRRIDKVVQGTGLSRKTVADIRDGRNTNPTWETVEKLRKYLEGRK